MFINQKGNNQDMNKKDIARTANILIFLVGLFFIVGSQMSITGSAVGAPDVVPEIRFIVGISLLIIAGLVYYVSRNAE
jgi:hypothetical protein